jgi:hypothetical protein
LTYFRAALFNYIERRQNDDDDDKQTSAWFKVDQACTTKSQGAGRETQCDTAAGLLQELDMQKTLKTRTAASMQRRDNNDDDDNHNRLVIEVRRR